jgi:putative peptidoglycan lipid II flippase
MLIGLFFGLDKIFALTRSALIARTFGVSMALDAFNAANNLPDLLFVLVSGGVLAIGLIRRPEFESTTQNLGCFVLPYWVE